MSYLTLTLSTAWQAQYFPKPYKVVVVWRLYLVIGMYKYMP